MKHYICMALIATMIVACFSGCGKQDNVEPSEMYGNTDNISANETIEPQIKHVAQEICDNLTIDADAVIPVKTQYGTYNLNMVDSDPDRLFGIFSEDGTDNYTTEDRSYPGATVFKYSKPDGRNIVVQDNVIQYSSYDIDMGDHPMQEVANLMYYYTQEHPNAQPHDLSFMTVTEMEAYGRNVLTELGIVWDMELTQCVTLSGQEILDFQNEMFTKSSYTEFGSPMKLSSAEDTCYVVFSFTYDGIPLFRSGEPKVESVVSMMPSPSAGAVLMVNANGIQDCTVQFPCVVEAISEQQTILTVDEAIAALKAKYDLEILFGTQVITDIWMEYIPVYQNQNWVLVPYWCFVSNDIELMDVPGYEVADRFNAITGEDLAYGG